MSIARLSLPLLEKIASKRNKPIKYIREQVSKRASRQAITSEAAAVVWARELGISTASVLRRLSPNVQEQVQRASSFAPTRNPPHREIVSHDGRIRQQDHLGAALDVLLSDTELRSRCADLLRKQKHSDRALREATTVLESRIRSYCPNHRTLNPEPLVNTVLNADISKAFIVVSKEPNEQSGIHSICRGIVLAFRHRAHHQLDDKVSRELAIKFCSFIDVLLEVLRNAQVRPGA